MKNKIIIFHFDFTSGVQNPFSAFNFNRYSFRVVVTRNKIIYHL